MIELITAAGGNLGSWSGFLSRMGMDFRVAASPRELSGLAPVVIPGVGSFGATAEKLRQAGFLEALLCLAESGTPVLGVCSGMQVLFESSEESPGASGLGLIEGRVERYRSGRIPNTGWSRLNGGGEYVYFVNSYYCVPDDGDLVVDTAEKDGKAFPAIVARGSVAGFQFHPEKSHRDGERIFRRWLK